MVLDQEKQFEKIITESEEILILLPRNPSGDSIGSAWALSFFLQKKDKKATIVFEDGSVGDKYDFLPKPEKVLHELSGTQDFILSFNTKFNKIVDIKTEKLDEELRVYITPEKGSIDPRDFSFIPSRFKYDALIVLGSPDRESLGKIFEDNPDIFYEVPVINIDFHPENDRFGQMNVLDMAASSVAEILFDMLEKIDENSLDEKISLCLLTAIIEATNSFQNQKTTPKSLLMSATLMNKGADQQKIIRYLYKTQPFSVLKLWGRVMARLRWVEDCALVWAPVLLEDFVQSRSNPKEVGLILDKIMENYSQGKIFMVVYAKDNEKTQVIIKSSELQVIKKLAAIFDGKISAGVVEFSQDENNLQAVGEKISEKISEILT